jgi:hypothetical protein
MQVRLGKLEAVHPHNALKLSKYMKALAPAPTVYLPPQSMTNLGMMLNDSIGDCAIAGPGHAIQHWTAQAGKQVILTDDQILAAYEAVSGYVPGNPNTDSGCVLSSVMNYWKSTGIGGHTIDAYAGLTPPPIKSHTSIWQLIFHGGDFKTVDNSWQTEIRNAAYYFGGVVIGLALPIALQNYTETDLWDLTPNDDDSKTQPGGWGGHCVLLIPGYDEEGITLVSWGREYKATWDFLESYMDEAWAPLSKDILSGDKSPEGFDYTTLSEDNQEITS